MRIKKKNLTLIARKIPIRKKLKVIEWNLRNHDLWGPFPLYAQIEVDAGCNLNCTMCSRNRFNTNAKLSLSQFKEIIDKLNYSVCHIAPWGYGESLLNPDFVSMMEYVRKKGMLFSLVTNGTLLHKHDMRKLLKLKPMYIMVSIDVPNAKEYEKIRLGADWDIVKENFANLVELRNELYISKYDKPKINITSSIGMHTMHHISNLIKLKDEWKADLIRFRDMVWIYDKGPSIKSNSIRENMSKEQIDALIEPYKERKDIIWWLHKPIKRLCIWPKNNTYIDSRGNVMICGCGAETFTILGNIFEVNSIMDIWNNEIFNRVREETITGEHGFNFCKACDSWAENCGDI